MRNILVANPEASRDGEVMDAVYNRVPALSQQTISDIENLVQTYTSLDVLNSKLGMLNQARHDIISKVIQYYNGNASSTTNIDSLQSFLVSLDLPEYHYTYVENLIAEEDFQNATSHLSNLPSIIDFTSYLESQHYDLESYYGVIISALSNGDRLDELNSADIATLQSLESNGTGKSKSKAMDLLILNGHEFTYQEPLYYPGDPTPKRSSNNRPSVPNVNFSNLSKPRCRVCNT